MPEQQKYRAAGQPAQVVTHLIENEKRFAGFVDAGIKILCAFCQEPEKDKGRVCLARVHKFGGLNACVRDIELGTSWMVPEPFVVIVFHEASWAELSDLQREALCFHELCHIDATCNDKTGEWSWRLIGHDVEEFFDVVAKYGYWMPGVEEFVKDAQSGQKKLFQD